MKIQRKTKDGCIHPDCEKCKYYETSYEDCDEARIRRELRGVKGVKYLSSTYVGDDSFANYYVVRVSHYGHEKPLFFELLYSHGKEVYWNDNIVNFLYDFGVNIYDQESLRDNEYLLSMFWDFLPKRLKKRAEKAYAQIL